MVKNGQEWAIVVNNGGITWYNQQEWMKNGQLEKCGTPNAINLPFGMERTCLYQPFMVMLEPGLLLGLQD